MRKTHSLALSSRRVWGESLVAAAAGDSTSATPSHFDPNASPCVVVCRVTTSTKSARSNCSSSSLTTYSRRRRRRSARPSRRTSERRSPRKRRNCGRSGNWSGRGYVFGLFSNLVGISCFCLFRIGRKKL